MKQDVPAQPKICRRNWTGNDVDDTEGIPFSAVNVLQIGNKLRYDIRAHIARFWWQSDVLHPVEIPTRGIQEYVYVKRN